MIKYLINRLLYVIPVVFLVSIIVFSFMHMIPGDPADAMLGRDAPIEQRIALRKQLGLDKSVPIQYLQWVGKIVRGDFGESMVYKMPVLGLILDKLPATFLLAVAAILVSSFFGIILGIVAGVRQGKISDMGVLMAALVWVSIPSFFFGLLMVMIFSIYIPVFPSIGYTSPLESIIGSLYHLTLPTVTLSALLLGGTTRVTRSEMIEQLSKDYVTTAWAKGLPRRSIIYIHTLKNALIPVITYVGLHFGFLMGGAVVVETIFSWPGIGRLIIAAINQRDYPMVQGCVLFLALVFIFVNLLVDISYTFLNPQIRLGRNNEK